MARVVPSQVVELIDKLFPEVRTQKEGGKSIHLSASNAHQLAALLDLVQQIPSELIVLSPEPYVEYVSSVAGLREFLVRLRSLGSYTCTRIPGLRPLNPVTLIRQALDACHDEYLSAGTSELNFIPDNDLRESLRRDMSAVNNALSNGEWKAATVLGGSVVEALLLWALQEKHSTPEITSAVKNLVANKTLDKSPGSNLEKWDLFHLIEVAADLNVIIKDTATETRLAKGYRNLIHPGRAIRLGQICNRATALTTVAALLHVIDDLTP